MATFTPGKPVSTDEPAVTVDGGLDLGTHRFQLRVQTADGRVSAPVELVVKVGRGVRPVLDPDLRDPNVRDRVVRDPAVREPVVPDPVVRDPVVRDPVVRDPTVREPVIRDTVLRNPDLRVDVVVPARPVVTPAPVSPPPVVLVPVRPVRTVTPIVRRGRPGKKTEE